MTVTAEKSTEHIGECPACSNPVHDLVQTMSRCVTGLWRYDQYIANAEGNSDLQQFWRDFKAQEQRSVERMKNLLSQELQSECESCR